MQKKKYDFQKLIGFRRLMGHCCVQHQLSFIKIPPFVFYTTKSVHFDLILGVFFWGGNGPIAPAPLDPPVTSCMPTCGLLPVSTSISSMES